MRYALETLLPIGLVVLGIDVGGLTATPKAASAIPASDIRPTVPLARGYPSVVGPRTPAASPRAAAAAARICRYCHSAFAAPVAIDTPAADGQAASADGAAGVAREPAERRMGRAILTGLIMFVVAGAGIVFVTNQVDPGLLHRRPAPPVSRPPARSRRAGQSATGVRRRSTRVGSRMPWRPRQCPGLGPFAGDNTARHGQARPGTARRLAHANRGRSVFSRPFGLRERPRGCLTCDALASHSRAIPLGRSGLTSPSQHPQGSRWCK